MTCRSSDLPERLVRLETAPAVALAQIRAVQLETRPRVALAGSRVRVGDRVLDQAEAVRLWSELGDALGLAERDRRPRAWANLVAWLDRAFADGAPVTVREGRQPLQGRAILVSPTRALVRLEPFAVAHLRRRSARSRSWTGTVAQYWPGSRSLSPDQPDAHLAFTERRIRASSSALVDAPTIGGE